MKHWRIIIVLSFMLIMWSNCSQGLDVLSTNKSNSSGLSVKIRKVATSTFATLADSAVCNITGSDIKQITKVLNINDSCVEGYIGGIPAGKGRQI